MTEEQASSGVQAPAAGGQGEGAQPQGQQAEPQGQQAPQPATQQPQGQEPSGQTPGEQAGQQPQQEVQIPLNVVTALRDEVQTRNNTISELQAQVEQFKLMQQMGGQRPGQQPQEQQAQDQQPDDPLSGMRDDDIVSVQDVRKILSTLQTQAPPTAEFEKMIQPLSHEMAKIQVQMRDPDYETTIKTHLPEMINSNPAIRGMIEHAPNKLLAALSIAQMNPKFQQAQQQAPGQEQQQQQPDILSDLQKIIENAAQPGTPASQGGSGAMQGYDRFKNMDDKDFDAEVQRVLSGTG